MNDAAASRSTSDANAVEPSSAARPAEVLARWYVVKQKCEEHWLKTGAARPLAAEAAGAAGGDQSRRARDEDKNIFSLLSRFRGQDANAPKAPKAKKAAPVVGIVAGIADSDGESSDGNSSSSSSSDSSGSDSSDSGSSAPKQPGNVQKQQKGVPTRPAPSVHKQQAGATTRPAAPLRPKQKMGSTVLSLMKGSG